MYSLLTECHSPGSVNRILELVLGREYEWLEVAQASISPLQGFFNCIVYGWTIPALRDRYMDILARRKSKRYEIQPLTPNTSVSKKFSFFRASNQQQLLFMSGEDDETGAAGSFKGPIRELDDK